jgi:GNAT superfamily N-acetyltransferase
MSELSRLTDGVELHGTEDLYRAQPEEIVERAGVHVSRSGSALVAVLSKVPSGVYSRVIGLGLDGPITAESADAAVARLRESGATRAFVHVSPYASSATREEVADLLEARGLTRHPRSWMRFVRETASPPPEAHTDFVIREARADEATRVDEIVRVAFELPEVARGVYEVVVDRPRWHVFVAEDRGTLVGTAALFVDGDVGWCAFGCVLKEARRRGGQSALLAARIERARALGCRVLFSETGEAVPGDPQHSYKNLLRSGFREAFTRPNYLYTRARD